MVALGDGAICVQMLVNVVTLGDPFIQNPLISTQRANHQRQRYPPLGPSTATNRTGTSQSLAIQTTRKETLPGAQMGRPPPWLSCRLRWRPCICIFWMRAVRVMYMTRGSWAWLFARCTATSRAVFPDESVTSARMPNFMSVRTTACTWLSDHLWTSFMASKGLVLAGFICKPHHTPWTSVSCNAGSVELRVNSLPRELTTEAVMQDVHSGRTIGPRINMQGCA